jgi:hypothetical protein
MSVQNISGRRGGVISWVAALVLLLLIAGFDNQWTENWRSQRPSASWQAQPVGLLGSFDWRATPFHGESTRVYAAAMAAAVIAVVATGLLAMLVCRGVGSERGRWPLFLGTWLVTCLAAAVSLLAGVLIAGDSTLKLDVGTTYTTVVDRGFGFGLYAGWLIGFVAVLVYGSTPGMDGYVADAQYDTPSGYDYGSAVPSASYSYSPTSPYSHGNGDYGDYGGYGGGEETTQVTPPYDPYGGRDY